MNNGKVVHALEVTVNNEWQPLTTVVITCYNIHEYITEAISSVLDQSYRKYEIVIVDDGSTDETRNVIFPFLNNNVKYLAKKNGGPSSARNMGIAHAEGDLIAFLDGDDIWEPDKLLCQVNAMLNNPNAGMIFSDFSTFDSSGLFVSCKNRSMFRNLEPLEYHYLVARNNFIYPSTVIVRKSCFEQCGVFDETLRGPEDWDMWLRIARHFDVLGLHSSLARIRQHSSNISTNVSIMLENERRAIEKQVPFLGYLEYRKRLARLYLLNSDRSIHKGDRLEAFRLLIRGVIAYPFLLVPFCIVLAKFIVGGKSAELLRRSIDKNKYLRGIFEIIYKRY
jgi:glycosyltransferase involved in cell wall biosynthesis